VGLLDDAIREHLELKRRSGASDEEVARKEAEALGPARRDFPAQVAEEPEPAEPVAEAEPHELEEEPLVEAAEPPPFAVEPELEQPPAYEPPRAAPEEQPPTEEYLIEDVEEPAAEPEREPAAEPEPPRRSDDDLLEDTPEFLQETPEHDRLWFEQKPPRDFDFE